MKLLAATLLLTTLLSAAAQTETRGTTLYRCGPEGRDLRDAPCPAGMSEKTAQIRYEQPSREQAQAARERVADTAAQAEHMEQQRLRREARERREANRTAPARINGLAGAPEIKPAEPVKTTTPQPPEGKPRKAKRQAVAAAR